MLSARLGENHVYIVSMKISNKGCLIAEEGKRAPNIIFGVTQCC